MGARARSTVVVSAAIVLSACSIDLSGLQRKDGSISPASDVDASVIDPDGIGAGAGATSASAAGSGAGGIGGPIAGAGTGAAGVSVAPSGASGASGIGNPGAGGAGVQGSAGSRPPPSAAGASAPPPAAGVGSPGSGVAGAGTGAQSGAGAPAAGAAGKPPVSTGSGTPAKTCGLPGLPCCTPGAMCDVGACLRGKCTDYGGFYALTSACTTNPCGSRNAYTAGCSCPSGFNETLLWSEARTCDNGDTGTTEVHSCSAARVPDIAYGGAFIEGPDASCAVGCKANNPLTGMCTCPEGTEKLTMTVGAVDITCPDAVTTLQLCIDADGMEVNFGGAYAVSQSAPNGCAAANPLTGLCGCPAEVTTPQSLHAGDWSIFVCNL